MTESADSSPPGTPAIAGVVHKRSPFSVSETVDRLSELVRAAGSTLFAVVDHSGEAERVGLSLRETKLVMFGNPMGGTPVMVAAPLAALDLPLKVLVWSADDGSAWMSYLTPQWLGARHGLSEELVAPLMAVEKLTDQIAL